MYRCRLCEKRFTEVPENSELLRGGVSALWRFPDRSIHELIDEEVQARRRHSRHTKTSFSDCELCQRENQAQPKQERDLQPSLEESPPEPQKSAVASEQLPTAEPEQTTMAAAFRKFQQQEEDWYEDSQSV